LYRNVIVAYDGSDEARDALALAGVLRDRDGVVTAVGRAPEPGPPPWLGSRELPPETGTKQLQGHIEDCGADLLVLGSSKSADPGRMFTGPVGRGLLSGCHYPVAIAPRGFARAPVRPRVVAIAFETEDESMHAVAEGAEIAHALAADTRLICLMPPLQSWALEAGTDAGYARADVERHHRDVYRHMLDHALTAMPRDVKAEGRLVTCSRKSALLDELGGDVGLLVMASPGVRPVPGVRPGAHALAALRAAPCPVLLTPTGVRHTHPPGVVPTAG
jgi:nucleotide-binding universal stress UspA family protein